MTYRAAIIAALVLLCSAALAVRFSKYIAAKP